MEKELRDCGSEGTVHISFSLSMSWRVLWVPLAQAAGSCYSLGKRWYHLTLAMSAGNYLWTWPGNPPWHTHPWALKALHGMFLPPFQIMLRKGSWYYIFKFTATAVVTVVFIFNESKERLLQISKIPMKMWYIKRTEGVLCVRHYMTTLHMVLHGVFPESSRASNPCPHLTQEESEAQRD